MKLVLRWMPVLISILVLAISMLIVMHTPPQPFAPAPFPAAVHVHARDVATLKAEIAHPLFTRGRPDGPADHSPDQPSVPPELSGIAMGQGRAVALVKDSKGEIVMAHVGETIDGWTVTSIAPRQVQWQQGQEVQTIPLRFSQPAAPSGPSPALPPQAAPATRR